MKKLLLFFPLVVLLLSCSGYSKKDEVLYRDSDLEQELAKLSKKILMIDTRVVILEKSIKEMLDIKEPEEELRLELSVRNDTSERDKNIRIERERRARELHQKKKKAEEERQCYIEKREILREKGMEYYHATEGPDKQCLT
ncbi:MAG: hypothetical protein V3T17_08515 [Pseudomonadales bacterium]